MDDCAHGADIRLGLSIPRVLGMLVFLGIGLAAKRNALYGVPILGVGFLVYALSRWGGKGLTGAQKSIRIAGSIIVLALAAVGVVFTWNWIVLNQPKLADYVIRLFL